MPDYYGLGDRNEAIVYAMTALDGWIGTEGAPAWLASRVRKMRSSR